ncbi:MAG: hypothetical protein WCP69_07360 [Bacteroidota bacterium]
MSYRARPAKAGLGSLRSFTQGGLCPQWELNSIKMKILFCKVCTIKLRLIVKAKLIKKAEKKMSIFKANIGQILVLQKTTNYQGNPYNYQELGFEIQ